MVNFVFFVRKAYRDNDHCVTGATRATILHFEMARRKVCLDGLNHVIGRHVSLLGAFLFARHSEERGRIWIKSVLQLLLHYEIVNHPVFATELKSQLVLVLRVVIARMFMT